MQTALIAISGAFFFELGAVIFAAGKLFQRVSDIDQRLSRIENSTCCGEEKE